MALEATLNAVKAVVFTDPTITADQLKAGIAGLKGDTACLTKMEAATPPAPTFSRNEVARLLHVHPQQVRHYANRGLLTPVYTGVRGLRARCYTGESVKALLEGRTQKVRG